MKKLLIEKLPRIIKNKNHLEKKLNVEITNRGKEIFIEGNAEDEFVAEKVLEALNFGFPFSNAIAIKTENCEFEILNIKNYTNKKDMKSIRARVIGTKGKTLQTLSELTQCYLELNENFVGIIGKPEHLKNAQDALILIIQGSKQSNVYKFLEKNQFQEPIDLGLRE